MRAVCCLVIPLLIASSPVLAEPLPGEWSVTASVLTRLFSYENDEARAELPASVTSLLEDEDIRGDEEDIVNTSVGAGYYFSRQLHAGLLYTDGIEIGFLDDLDFGGLFSFGLRDEDNVLFNAHMKMLELDLRYRAYEFSESLAFFVTGGMVIHRISVDVEDYDEGQRTPIISTTETSLGAKVGGGLQWDFSDSWGVSLSYSHFTFMSIDNTSLMFEYRF